MASMSTICLECWWALEDRARTAESKLESTTREFQIYRERSDEGGKLLFKRIKGLELQLAEVEKLKQGYYDEAAKGWQKFREAELQNDVLLEIVRLAHNAQYSHTQHETDIWEADLRKALLDLPLEIAEKLRVANRPGTETRVNACTCVDESANCPACLKEGAEKRVSDKKCSRCQRLSLLPLGLDNLCVHCHPYSNKT